MSIAANPSQTIARTIIARWKASANEIPLANKAMLVVVYFDPQFFDPESPRTEFHELEEYLFSPGRKPLLIYLKAQSTDELIDKIAAQLSQHEDNGTFELALSLQLQPSDA